MSLVDTHTHLYLPEFDEENAGGTAVMNAIMADVQHMVFPNVNEETIEPMLALWKRYQDSISVAMGLHPTELGDDWQEVLERICNVARWGIFRAIGEVGMDLYWDTTREQEQMQAFDRQLSLAEELNLPTIIHCRNALPQTLEVLQGHKGAKAVFHSFGGDAADVDRIRAVGDFYFGINGIVTFKNCHVRDTLPEITLSRIMLETDSPYLAPAPHRGKRNESSYLPFVAKHIAAHMGISFDEVADATTANATHFFNLTP